MIPIQFLLMLLIVSIAIYLSIKKFKAIISSQNESSGCPDCSDNCPPKRKTVDE